MNFKMLTMGAMALAMMTGSALAATHTSALDDPAKMARIDPFFAQCNGQLGGLPLLERHLDIGKCGAEAAEGRGDQGIERRRFGESHPHLPR